MASRLLAGRGADIVSRNWVENFVKRSPEFETPFTQRSYQMDKCENPGVISSWFSLLRNTIAKYGILQEDIYNFDETGFLMGAFSSVMVVTTSEGRGKAKLIQPGKREWATVIQAVNSQGWAIPPYIILKGKVHMEYWYMETDLPGDWCIRVTDNGWTTDEGSLCWIKHFDNHTAHRTKGSYRLLVLDPETYHSTDFELYCRAHNIVTLCMPPHSSYLLQPLDVGCFGPLKEAYGEHIEALRHGSVARVTKLEFLCAFKTAFLHAMTEENIRCGFIGSGLVPLDEVGVLCELDVELTTPTPPGPPLASSDPRVSEAPQSLLEANAQFIKTYISKHQNRSPRSIIPTGHLTEGEKALIRQMDLLKAGISSLAKHQRAKGTRDLQDIQDQDLIDEQIKQEMQQYRNISQDSQPREPRCSNCGKNGHNARTCQEGIEMFKVYRL